jgi:hypothetical protein
VLVWERPLDTLDGMTDPINGRMQRLRVWNIVLGGLHLFQGIVVLLLTNEYTLPVTATFLDDAPGLAPPSLQEWFDIRVGWGVALFLFISAAAHWIIAFGAFGWYRDNLLRDRNYARWIEYALSSSVMVVLIAMLTGISDVAALISIFGVNAAMILFGLLVEKYETPGEDASLLSYWYGVLAGAVPWIVILIYLWSPETQNSPPGFVYGIFVSLFVFFNSFAVNMVLQYRRVGKWSDYLYGERVYMLLSLFAKSALAWQVFSGTLID